MSHVIAFRPLFELLAMGALCGYAASLAFGVGPFSPVRSMLVGILGIFTGWVLWQSLRLPWGPWVSGFPVVPSVAGTLVVVVVAEVIKFFSSDTGLPRGMLPRGDGIRKPRVMKDSPSPRTASPPPDPHPATVPDPALPPDEAPGPHPEAR